MKAIREHVTGALITLPIFWAGWQLLDRAWAVIR